MFTIESLILPVLLLAGLSFTISLVSRAWLLRRNILDIPNHRSAHKVPVPRAGVGMSLLLAIVLVVTAVVYQHTGLGAIALTVFILAGIGFYDDVKQLSARLRLLVQLLIAALLVLGIGPIDYIPFAGTGVDLGLLGIVLSVFGLVWLVNLFNFMDGINGLSLLQGIFYGVAGALIMAATGVVIDLISPMYLMMAAVLLGTLPLNFPTARLFLGDAGSTSIGAVVAGLFLLSVGYDPTMLWFNLILLAAFVTDATYTLLRRVSLRFSPIEPHNFHVYQKLARRLGSHSKVTLLYGAINVLWLAPLSLWYLSRVASDPSYNPTFIVLIAYAPLLVGAWLMKGGDSRS